MDGVNVILVCVDKGGHSVSLGVGPGQSLAAVTLQSSVGVNLAGVRQLLAEVESELIFAACDDVIFPLNCVLSTKKWLTSPVGAP